MEKIRILNVVPNMRAAGIETFIMNLYRNIDREKIQFDFIVHNKERQFYDDEIEKMGGIIYRFTLKDDKNILKYIKDLNNFFKNHKEYKIIHGHMQSMLPLYLMVAKINGVKIRIAHAHNNSYEKSLKGIVLHLFSRFTKCFSTLNFACSDSAGKYLFGHKKFHIINNGIDVNKFIFSEENRILKRNELNINNKFVIGHIGRFEKQKNHLFLIDIFDEILKLKKDSILVLIGEGKEEKCVKEYIKKKNIENNVIFLGIRNDISELLSSFDVFVLPSIYEGLGIVLIEAQTSGLSCFTSKDVVAKESNVSKNIEYISLKKDANYWAEQIIKKYNSNRKINIKKINDKFDIKYISKDLQKKYISLYKKYIKDVICNE